MTSSWWNINRNQIIKLYIRFYLANSTIYFGKPTRQGISYYNLEAALLLFEKTVIIMLV